MSDQLMGFAEVGVILVAYFLGNINPSIIIGKIAGIDIKKEGSGNAGTTNALRVLGKKAAAISLVIDICKGVAAVLLGSIFDGNVEGFCALAVVIGHVWPAVYGFRGGKGVATTFGAILAINWVVALLALAVAGLGLLLSKRMSVGSVIAAISLPVITYYLEGYFFVITVVIAVIVLIKHKDNIVRLMKGEEPKLSFKSSKKEK